MKKVLISLLIFSGFISSVYATSQIRDVLQISDNYYPIRELPLNSLLTEDELIKIIKGEMCTASWRGYQADWELKEGYLWLNDIEKNPCNSGYKQLKAEVLFKGKEYPIKAGWFTGKLHMQIGETEYLFVDNDENKDLIGVNFEALIFVFKKGKLISKNIELIEVRY